MEGRGPRLRVQHARRRRRRGGRLDRPGARHPHERPGGGVRQRRRHGDRDRELRPVHGQGLLLALACRGAEVRDRGRVLHQPRNRELHGVRDAPVQQAREQRLQGRLRRGRGLPGVEAVANVARFARRVSRPRHGGLRPAVGHGPGPLLDALPRFPIIGALVGTVTGNKIGMELDRQDDERMKHEGMRIKAMMRMAREGAILPSSFLPDG